MPDGPDDELDAALRAIALDPATPAHIRLGALNKLGAGAVAAREEDRPVDLLDDLDELRGETDLAHLPPDPMRDLDFQERVGRPPHPVFLAAIVSIPPGTTSAYLVRAERLVVDRARALGVPGAEAPVEPARAPLRAVRKRRGV